MLRELNQRFSLWLRREDTRYELSLVVFTLFVRILTSKLPVGPDPNQKWGYARLLLSGGQLSAGEFNHHHARWGVNIPLLLTQAVFGQGAACQFIAPILFAVLLSLLLYHVGKRLGGPGAGIAAAVLTQLVPSYGSLFSVAQPNAFEAVYLIGSLYALSRSAEVRHGRWLWLACAAAFLAYLAKETSVFVLPGLAYYAWRSRGRLSDLATYCGAFVALFLVEVLAYRVTYGFSFGRASIIGKHHIGSGKLNVPLESFWVLFDRYFELEPVFDFLFYGALLSTLCIPLWFRYRRREAVPALLKGALAANWGFFFATTFALKSINPLLPAQPLLPRYLFAGVPFLALIVGWALSEWGGVLWRSLNTKVDARRLLVAVPLLAAVGVAAVYRLTWSATGIARTMRLEKAVQAAFRDGTPILMKERNPRIRNVERAIRLLYLTQSEAKRMRVVEGRTMRAVVDGTREEYKGPAAALAKRMPEWRKRSRPNRIDRRILLPSR
jgi:4-amino-4-deoxy-L-arabinose transferase-like glycosyltransferase